MNIYLKKLLFRILIYTILSIIVFSYINLCKIGYGIPCFFYENFHFLCPGCGATRALISILSGDLSLAISYNPVYTLAFYPILLILFVQDFLIAIIRTIRNKKMISLLEFIFMNKKARGEI